MYLSRNCDHRFIVLRVFKVFATALELQFWPHNMQDNNNGYHNLKIILIKVELNYSKFYKIINIDNILYIIYLKL
jgi:hypothetical protein